MNWFNVHCALCGHLIGEPSLRPPWISQFKAVHATDGEPNLARLSGIGNGYNYGALVYPEANPPDGTQIVNISLMRSNFGGGPGHDDATSLGAGSDLAEGGRQGGGIWGFPFHVACWDVLAKVWPEEPLDVAAAHDLLRSFPIENGTLNFGHDYCLVRYGNVLDSVSVLYRGRRFRIDVGGILRRDAPRKADVHWFLEGEEKQEEEDTCSARDDVQARPLGTCKAGNGHDPFFKLPDEILHQIVEYLPSKDVVLLKRSSRPFATLRLAAAFWRSRFLPGNELDFFFTGRRKDTFLKGRWESLYRWAKSLDITPDGVDRSRIWKLASSMRDVLDSMHGVGCDGDPVRSFFERAAPLDDKCWITATRALKDPTADFDHGRRSLRDRVITVPSGPVSLLLSWVEVFGRAYISGFRVVAVGGMQVSLGYRHSARETLLCPESGEVFGFCLAQDERGIRGIAALSQAGEVSSRWIGDYRDIPKRRLVLDSIEPRAIKYIKGGFDGLKLVSLSVSDDASDESSADSLSLRDSATWLSGIPDEGLFFSGVSPTEAMRPGGRHPFSVATRGETFGSRGRRRGIRRVVVRLGHAEYIRALDVYFGDEECAVRLGAGDAAHPASWEDRSLDLDLEGGEKITSLDGFNKGNGVFLGFKVTISFLITTTTTTITIKPPPPPYIQPILVFQVFIILGGNGLADSKRRFCSSFLSSF
ncbi:hypothetical protein N3K66_005887 [Trichothecium roseum]|uniref:Uncharacterized protein n=1 Tax=Trichothecium roseum TaxID=47278 RepID=A0ACC0UZP0_9HYPO|nr:hypothetical protein N3K66_005887 [Trichothecium roseum]